MAFYPLEKLSQLYDGYQQDFQVNGLSLLLVQTEGKPHILENRCPHMDVPLTHARQLPGSRIQCRAHGIEFELSNGQALGPLSNTIDCLKSYPVAYDGNAIGIDL